mmetsp:Transcript_7440/g.18250  ORF Transcript_7440/g.18250 Transcript_7440/m.18250 type:complete len:401 (+) Transcript_7440:160-1362(+)
MSSSSVSHGFFLPVDLGFCLRSWRLWAENRRESSDLSSRSIRRRRSPVVDELPIEAPSAPGELSWLFLWARRSIRESFSWSFRRLSPAFSRRSFIDSSLRLLLPLVVPAAGADVPTAERRLVRPLREDGVGEPGEVIPLLLRASLLSCRALRARSSSADREVDDVEAAAPPAVRPPPEDTASGRFALRAAARSAARRERFSAAVSGREPLSAGSGTFQAASADSAADSWRLCRAVESFASVWASPSVVVVAVVRGGAMKFARIPLRAADPAGDPNDRRNFVLALLPAVSGLARLNPSSTWSIWLLSPAGSSLPSALSPSFSSFLGPKRPRTDCEMFLAHMFGRTCLVGVAGGVPNVSSFSPFSSSSSSSSSLVSFVLSFFVTLSSSLSSSSCSDGTYRSR